MSGVAIQVEGLSKRYRIGACQRSYRTFREAIVDTLLAPVRRLSRLGRPVPEAQTLWALKDVSFTVRAGEVVGIIGRNGAGKSTLLKILSRITDPTEGAADIHGRVGSLLEVGTGFHPELTGRENIYLNGAILGMRRGEIRRKFDEIVAFAEIDKFIDTPVKRYSSGMYMRLAFAVAAHLEPEILLVDEVLAVGDAGFQKKCLGKMGEVAKEGRTVFFVSHNMGAIASLCSRAIWLEHGQMVTDGPAGEILTQYMESVSEVAGSVYVCERRPNARAWIQSAELRNAAGKLAGSFLMTEPMAVECVLQVAETLGLTLSVQIRELNGSPLYHFPNGDTSYELPSGPGRYRVRAQIPPLHLYPGQYLVRLCLCDSVGTHFERLHVVENMAFQVQQDYSLCPRPLGRHCGVVYASAEWSDLDEPRAAASGVPRHSHS